jgi:hypothetical protein
MAEITRQMIEERLALYRREAEQMMRMIEVYKGGIQDCEHWLAVMDGKAPAVTPIKQSA